MSKAKEDQKVPVSVRAIIQRLNRKLKEKGQILKATRDGSAAEVDMGKYYIIDIDRNILMYHHTDLENCARNNGALAEWEAIA